jgi:hypothetical protein
LLPKEAPYLSLLAVRGVPSAPHSPVLPPPAAGAGAGAGARAGAEAGAPPDVCTVVRSESARDRDLLEKGTRAFVGFMRGYKEHQCKFIFRPEALDIPALALSFGLVRLPKVDELRGKVRRVKVGVGRKSMGGGLYVCVCVCETAAVFTLGAFPLSQDVGYEGLPEVLTRNIPYLEPEREKQRLLRAEADAEKNAAERVSLPFFLSVVAPVSVPMVHPTPLTIASPLVGLRATGGEGCTAGSRVGGCGGRCRWTARKGGGLRRASSTSLTPLSHTVSIPSPLCVSFWL